MKIKKVLVLTVLVFAVAAFAGCGKKAPPMPPDEAAVQEAGPTTI